MRRCAWPLLRLSARAGLALRHGGAVRLRPAAASSSSSSGGGGGLRAPDTSLFVPVPLKPVEGAAEEDVGAELTRPLDKGEVLKNLNKFYKRKEIQRLGTENGLDARLFHQAFISFRKYIMESSSVSADLHIILNDICCGAGHVDDLFPFFLRHAKQIFPMLDCMDDLRKISDLRLPPNWYPEARAIQRKIIFHAGPTNSGKTYHAIQRFLSAKSGIYCGPLKLLAHEIFQKSNAANVPCDLVTGEERVYATEDARQASHIACTIEMCSTNTPYEVAVIDEIQMIRDPARGWAWTRALLGLCAEEIHVCGEGAAIDLVTELMYTTGEEVEVRNYKRLTPLTVLDYALESLDNLQPGDCIVCFSKNDIYSVSRQIEARGLECAVIYGSLPPGEAFFLLFLRESSDFDAFVMSSLLSLVTTLSRNNKPLCSMVFSQDIFVSLSQVDGLYFVCNIDDFKFLADMIQHIPLNLRSRYVFCTAPLNRKEPFVCTTLLKFARQFSRNEPLTFDWLCRHTKWPLAPPKNIKELVHLEAVHDVFDLYLWLSYRFMDMFPDAALVRDIQKKLDDIIQIGVCNITKLIRASQSGAAPGTAEVMSEGFPLSRTKRDARTVSDHCDAKSTEPLSVEDLKSHGRGSLANRLLREGLLTQEMLRQLESEWQDQRRNGRYGLASKRNDQSSSKEMGKKKK
uniref:ATP-dependent RNA helicase SUPV3L1, mitochondrial n=1 Tax=Pavo cristatus TaxID=9049 RepID=A0A8C9LGL8_PAVCR